jgi:hypothetical protein
MTTVFGDVRFRGQAAITCSGRVAKGAIPGQVLTFKEWCQLNGFSTRTGRRILDRPKSQRPVITWMSERRMGVTRGNNRRWQERRAK